jgi:hypothetical protein
VLQEIGLFLSAGHPGTVFLPAEFSQSTESVLLLFNNKCGICPDRLRTAATNAHWDYANMEMDKSNDFNNWWRIFVLRAAGQLTQSHAMGPFDGPEAAEARAFTMAAFLIGAGNLSYFSYANWAVDCWTLAGTRWWPEYDRPVSRTDQRTLGF